MSFISNLTPINQAQEKLKFFTDDNYNPQFKYVRSLTKDELTQWGMPDEKVAKHAEQMLGSRGINQLEFPNKRLVSQAEILAVTNLLCDQLAMPRLEIKFLTDLSAPCILTKQQLIFRLPIHMNLSELTGRLNHEIQSHYLRRLNHQKQIWHAYKEPEFKLRPTEEGVAVINKFIKASLPESKHLSSSFLGYLSTYLAMSNSFSGIYKYLIEIGCEPNLAWNKTLSSKRGIKDTQKSGGNTKGKTYLDGVIKVSSWLESNDPRNLYIGTLAIESVSNFKKTSIDFNSLILPTFLNDPVEYQHQVHEIMDYNQLQELTL